MLTSHDILTLVNYWSNTTISLIDLKKRTLRLHAFNTIMAVTMSSTVFIVSMQASAILTISLLEPTQLANSIPQWIQLTPQVNTVFYISLVFAMVTTAAVAYMLYRMHENSKQIAKENIREEVLDKHEKQTISYCDKEGAQEDEHYVKLDKKYDGCILKSPSGKREAFLTPDRKEDGDHKLEDGQYRYKAIQYNNYKRPEITITEFKEDFFKGESSREVTIYTTNPSKLMDKLLLSQPTMKPQEPSK